MHNSIIMEIFQSLQKLLSVRSYNLFNIKACKQISLLNNNACSSRKNCHLQPQGRSQIPPAMMKWNHQEQTPAVYLTSLPPSLFLNTSNNKETLFSIKKNMHKEHTNLQLKTKSENVLTTMFGCERFLRSLTSSSSSLMCVCIK